MKSPLFVGGKPHSKATNGSVPGTAPVCATACLQLKGLSAVRGRLATKPAGAGDLCRLLSQRRMRAELGSRAD